MNTFEEAYAGIVKARKAYHAAVDEAGKKAAMGVYKEATKNVKDLAGAEQRIWKAYEAARDNGNECLDIDWPIIDGEAEELIACMRKHSIKGFTFSSGWSNAVETAWLFQKAGCKLAGLVEINTQYMELFSNEHEKTHGYFFELS